MSCCVQMCGAWVWWLVLWLAFHSASCSSFSSSGWSSEKKKRRNMRRRRHLMRSGEISVLIVFLYCSSTLTLNIPAAEKSVTVFLSVQDSSMRHTLHIVCRTIFIIHQTAVFQVCSDRTLLFVFTSIMQPQTMASQYL